MNTDAIIGIFQAALRAADPRQAVRKVLHLSGDVLAAGDVRHDLKRFTQITVVGAGKGAAPMAEAAEEILDGRIGQGMIIVKYGHVGPLRRITQVEASHPLPDEPGVKGTEKIMEMLKHSDEATLVLCLFSGGASSLLVAPAEGISLEEERVTTELLLSSGADIVELNAVRKHLSKIKGGRLAEMAYPATIVSLVLSDVIGDRLDVIASGPVVPDRATFGDAIAVMRKYSLERDAPPRVMDLLRAGLEGKIPDTPKGGEAFFERTHNLIIGSLGQSLAAARERASSLGFDPVLLTSELRGEARDAARFLAGSAVGAKSSLRAGRPACLIAGGETTVTVRGRGLGGRNQELALAFAVEIEGMKGVTLLSAGTDGTDGPTDAAGAIVDGETAVKAKRLGMDPVAYLEDNDSYSFFKKLDSLSGERHHLRTGPTGTNVMDVQIIMIEGQERATQ